MSEGEHSKSASSASTGLVGITDDVQRQSPPKAIVDSTPLQPQMDKNKESLKVKLMVRRTMNELIQQNIIPPPKPSPTLHQQYKQLERAKTGDVLKQKILHRPQREELERRHILDHQQNYIDPSIAEKRRLLSKAMIADHLNSKISHRPGPLELIEKNILHTEEPIEQLVKEGLVTYKAANEGIIKGPQHPNSYVVDDDSQSSEGDPLSMCSQSENLLEVANSGVVTVALTIPSSGGAVVVTSAPLTTTNTNNNLSKMPSLVPTTPQFVSVSNNSNNNNSNSSDVSSMCVKQELQSTPNLYAQLCQSTVSSSPVVGALSPQSLSSTTSSLSPMSSVASPPATIISKPIPATFLQSNQQQQKSDAPGKDKNKKKSKTKATAKARTIKFHEYKGPPSAQKSNNVLCTGENGETNYQLAMKQQYLLQYLEQIYKHPHILPATQKPVQASANPPPLQQLQTQTIMTNHIQSPPQQQQIITQTNNNNNCNEIQQNNITIAQNAPSSITSVSIPPSPASTYSDSTVHSDMGKMKVSDLKQQLKKLNLKVSGSKQALIERLKQHMPLDMDQQSNIEQESISGETCDFDAISTTTPHQSPSSAESDFDNTMDTTQHQQQIEQQSEQMITIKQEPMTPQPMQITIGDEDIVREQQRQIEELQRSLRQAQEQLEQMKQKKMDESEPVSVRLKHTLEAKMQKEKLAQLEAQQKHQQQMLAIQQLKHQQQLLQLQQQQQNKNVFVTTQTNASNKPQIQGQQQPQVISSQPPALNAFITPIKKEITFYENNQTIPIPTLLVCVQDKKTHQRTTSMPSIVLPLTATGPPPLVEASQPITIQQQQIVQTTPVKHHIPLPQSSPPELRPIDPLPPPHYDEATKIIEDNKKQQQQLAQTLAAQNVPPLAKCLPVTCQVQALSKVRKNNDRMPQALKDVYEILSKNGELPESANISSDPTTPETPSTNNSNVNQVMMINPNLMFDNSRLRGQMNGVAINNLDLNSGVSNDAPSSDIPSSLLLDGGSDLLNLPVLSPMQQDCIQSDPEETLDKLLAQAQQTNECHTPQDSPFHHPASSPGTPGSSANHAPSQLMSDFNDLELLEFPMDIEDETAFHHSQMLQQHTDSNSTNHMINNTRTREMNPSLTPSLNELIQIQQQQQQQQHHQNDYENSYSDSMNNNNNNNNENNHCNTNHFGNETPMDFENLLSNFEIPTNYPESNIGVTRCGGGNGSFDSIHHISSPAHHFGGHCFNSQPLLHSNHTTNNLHHHFNNQHENILEFFNDDFRMGSSDVISCEVDNLLLLKDLGP
uniref:CSON010247 protein n=1 Tax=Culicoides sonorensis TaxID=179676 RepID=A0A336M5B9_CULSO